MKIETQNRDDHQVSMTVVLDETQMEGAKHRAARKISERKSIPGFRPGKAPYEVVLRTYGEGVIVEEAVDLLLDEIYPKALEEAKLEPAAPGSLEKMDDLDKKPKFTFLVPLAPMVDLGDFRSIRLPYDYTEPGEDKVDESVDELRRMYAKTETVQRPIEVGDFVLIDLVGKDTKAEEGSAPIFDRPGMPVFIQTTEKADEFPFSGFSQKLTGLAPDESRTISHKFAKDHKDENLAGKSVQFEVKLKLVRSSILPELNDEFAKMVGPFTSLQALRDVVQSNLLQKSVEEYEDDYFARLLEEIKKKATIQYAPQTLNHEVEHVLEDLKGRLAQQGMDLEAYLKSREMEQDKFIEEEAKPVAIKRLERSLILDEIAKAEKIELTEDILKSSFQQTWGEFQGNAGFQKYMNGKSQPPKRIIDAVAMESANRAYLQQTLKRMKEIASGTAVPAETKAKKAAPKTKAKAKAAAPVAQKKKPAAAKSSAGKEKTE